MLMLPAVAFSGVAVHGWRHRSCFPAEEGACNHCIGFAVVQINISTLSASCTEIPMGSDCGHPKGKPGSIRIVQHLHNKWWTLQFIYFACEQWWNLFNLGVSHSLRKPLAAWFQQHHILCELSIMTTCSRLEDDDESDLIQKCPIWKEPFSCWLHVKSTFAARWSPILYTDLLDFWSINDPW